MDAGKKCGVYFVVRKRRVAKQDFFHQPHGLSLGDEKEKVVGVALGRAASFLVVFLQTLWYPVLPSYNEGPVPQATKPQQLHTEAN